MLSERGSDGRSSTQAATQAGARALVRNPGVPRKGGAERSKHGSVTGAGGGTAAHVKGQGTGAETYMHKGVPAAAAELGQRRGKRCA